MKNIFALGFIVGVLVASIYIWFGILQALNNSGSITLLSGWNEHKTFYVTSKK